MVTRSETTTKSINRQRQKDARAASILNELPDDALVGRDMWMSLLDCSGATVGRRIKDGTIPQPCVWLTSCTPRWRIGVVRAALAKIIAGQKAAA